MKTGDHITGSTALAAHYEDQPLNQLMAAAAGQRDTGKGDIVTYSRKVFIPLTELCRNVCHYCTYAKTPGRLKQAYLLPEEVIKIAEAGKAADCRAALFTLGDKPELRYETARKALKSLGCKTTLDYVKQMAQLVRDETGLLPHLNPGILQRTDYVELREVAASMGIMLESTAKRLTLRDGPHFGSPDKLPQTRLMSIAAAGAADVPLTTGILIGIGESRQERIDSLTALLELHERYGHIQEIIIQNFVPKAGTKMHAVAAPADEELLWTVAVARHIFGPDMNLQAPPNLNADLLPALIAAGINDWGGVSPITPDHVNPESPWPHLGQLAEQTAAAGKRLTQRLTIYPQFALQAERWIHPALHASVLQHSDSEGYSREDAWVAGTAMKPPLRIQQIPAPAASRQLADILTRAEDGLTLTAAQIETLFAARGDDFASVCLAADAVRIEHSGNEVTYAVNRNINYTNLCVFKCRFCAFSKGKTSENLRGAPYVLDMDEISRRTEEAWSRGATEVCLQGGIHPAYTGHAYLDICRAVKDAAQDMHIHAFSPLEVMHGAQTLGKSIEAFLTELKAAGLESLPGTAAEILDDEIRRVICPDKLDTDGWFNIISTAHKIGLQTTGTIMFGHIEAPRHWAVHLLRLRTLQEQTGGITEFVPLPFIHMESPMYYRGHARRGPTYRETLLMHAIARLALNPVLNNIQTSWVKLGTEVAADCLNAGANDLGGTLMNESISRAAGADHGQELAPPLMDALIETLGRTPRQRTTLYNTPPAERINASYRARPLTAIHNQPAKSFKAAS